MEEYQKKISNNMNTCASGMLLISYLVTFILIIIWLFKLLSNAEIEPGSRSRYIIEELTTFYTEEELCYEKYEPFIVKGALDTFDIPTKNIRKYCKALLSTIFISFGSIILSSILVFIGTKSYRARDCCMCLGALFYLFLICGVILSLVFAIILMHYYSKGDYQDFEEFSRCRYLTKQFRRDYDFIFKIKNGYQMPFALIIITEFFNFIKLIVESRPKEND